MYAKNIIGGRRLDLSSKKLHDDGGLDPSNDFTIKLPYPIDVKREVTSVYNATTRTEQVTSVKFYELALVYLRCMKSWHNISSSLNNNKFRYSLDGGTTYHTITFANGHYDMNDIIDTIKEQLEINNHINSDGEYVINFIPNYPTLKTKIRTFPLGSTEAEDVIIDFSQSNFGKLLGFTELEYTSSSRYISERNIKLSTIEEILVHCEEIVGSTYNNDKSQIIYRFNPCTGTNGIIQFNIENPIYLPVSGERIESIRMKMTDQDGNPIDFNGEDVSYVLHIRKNVN